MWGKNRNEQTSQQYLALCVCVPYVFVCLCCQFKNWMQTLQTSIVTRKFSNNNVLSSLDFRGVFSHLVKHLVRFFAHNAFAHIFVFIFFVVGFSTFFSCPFLSLNFSRFVFFFSKISVSISLLCFVLCYFIISNISHFLFLLFIIWFTCHSLSFPIVALSCFQSLKIFPLMLYAK